MSHPSILDWESNNGTMEESVGTALLSINSAWDPINTRVAADRTPDNVNGYLLGCTLEGCEVGSSRRRIPRSARILRTTRPGDRSIGEPAQRGAWPGTTRPRLSRLSCTTGARAKRPAPWAWRSGTLPTLRAKPVNMWRPVTAAPLRETRTRSDLSALPRWTRTVSRSCCIVYEAAWTPFTIKPVIRLAGHWNLSREMFR